MRQTDRTSWTVAAWLLTEDCYVVQLMSGWRGDAKRSISA